MTTETSKWAPSSCTLPTAERPLREKEFEDLFASSLQSAVRTSPTNAELVLNAQGITNARDLARRETSCCSFFSFEIREAGEEAVMSMTVPSAHTAVLDALVDTALRAADSRATRA
jgi:hypothetical protein